MAAITRTEGNNSTIIRDSSAPLGPQLSVNIFSYLPPHDIRLVQLACREFRDLTIDASFWEEKLRSDFGEAEVNAARLENKPFKQAYQENYEKFKKLKQELRAAPKVLTWEEYGEIVQEDTIGHEPIAIPDKLDPQNLDSYINGLSDEELNLVFYQAANQSYMPLFEAIVSHKRFSKITINALGTIFVSASGRGDLRMMRILIGSGRINEIDPNGFIGSSDTLAVAFREAAANGCVKAMELIMSLDRFKEIVKKDDDAPCTISEALLKAQSNLQKEAVLLIEQILK